MGKSVLIVPRAEAARIVFGLKGERNIKFLAKKADIPRSSCLAYRDNIDRMPLERFSRVCKAAHLTDEEILKAVKQFY